MEKLTRRQFLRFGALTGASFALAACVPNPNILPLPTIVPTITPAVRPSRAPTKEELKEFAIQKIGKIFQDSYLFAKQQTGRPYESNWIQEEVNRVYGYLSGQLQQLPSDLNPVFAQLGLEMRELAYDKYFDDLPGMYKDPSPQYRWIGYIRALKEIFEREKGVIVHPILFGWPPTISISTDVEPAQERTVTPMGIVPFSVYIHKINKENLVLDTFNFLQGADNGVVYPWQRQVAYVDWSSNRPEIYNYQESLTHDVEFLLMIGEGKRLPKEGQNPPLGDAEAEKIFETAQRLIRKTVGNDRVLVEKTLFEEAIAHESAHAMKSRPATTQFEEARSYLEELRSQIPLVARLSLAKMLYEISRQEVIDKVKQEGNYLLTNPNIAGMQLIVNDLVEAIKEDKLILEKLEVREVKNREPNSFVSRFLPYSTLDEETMITILSRLDRLEDSDLNRLAETIIRNRKGDMI